MVCLLELNGKGAYTHNKHIYKPSIKKQQQQKIYDVQLNERRDN